MTLKEGVTLHLNKLRHPSSKDALCQERSLKVTQQFLKRSKLYENLLPMFTTELSAHVSWKKKHLQKKLKVKLRLNSSISLKFLQLK